ncbi:hypothetical protein SEA_ZUCKER_33 [Arthrobacter phage Zucker]|nr:hypothetical protein SEA_ZUCKER_33 [Arthrobacter phage Zucker]
MASIIDFLEARIDEDETHSIYVRDWGSSAPDPLFAPGRVLAECAAKRSILVSLASTSAAHAKETHLGQKLVLAGMDTGLRLALQALALPYREHPDYQQEWAA